MIIRNLANIHPDSNPILNCLGDHSMSSKGRATTFSTTTLCMTGLIVTINIKNVPPLNVTAFFVFILSNFILCVDVP